MSSAYLRVKEVRGQVPGTTCNGARTNSAINNTQASSYLREEREWRAGLSAPGAKSGGPKTPLAGVTVQYIVILLEISLIGRYL